jgi:hypothetical protein
MSESSFPLYWPTHVPRTKIRGRAAFSTKYTPVGGSYARSRYKTLAEAMNALERELDRLIGSSASTVLSTNLSLRLDGAPRSGQAQPLDPGAALYFTRNKQRICMPCDRWDRVEDNVYAIAKHIEAMRGMDRWGVGTTEQAFAGYKALSPGENWWDVLGCHCDADEGAIRMAYRARLHAAHPDTGGSHEAMTRLNQARDQALETVTARQRPS